MIKNKYIELTDNYTKKLLSYKEIQAYILKLSIREFYNMDVHTIAKDYIISATNENHPFNDSRNKELIINEMKFILDMCIEVKIPGKKKAFIDIEMQKEYYYIDLHVRRSLMYEGALIFDQIQKLDSKRRYHDILPVYSIWLIMDPPKGNQNSIIEIGPKIDVIYGKFKSTPKIEESLELFKSIFIFLGENGTMKLEGLDVLNAIFNVKMDHELRQELLEKSRLSFDIKKEVNEKMNVGRALWNEAERKGRKQGIKEGIKEGIKQGIVEGKQEERLNTSFQHVERLMKKGFSLEDAINLLEIDEQIANKIRDKFKV